MCGVCGVGVENPTPHPTLKSDNVPTPDIRPYCEEEAIEAKKSASKIYEQTKIEENWYYYHKQMQLELSRPLNKKQIRWLEKASNYNFSL